jgi:glycerophosphoryl diester phosphodiesterase
MTNRPLVLGHRGASRACPENTLAAFAQARAFGADGVELDVRRTADDTLVVNHDPQVDGFGVIVDHPFAALRAAHPSVPTLAEALDACAGLIVNVEIKCLPWEPDADTPDRAVVRAVLDLLRRGTAVPLSDIIVSSFDLGAVDATRELAPEIATGWLTHGQDVSVAAPITADHGHAWLNPDREAALRASSTDVAAAQRAGVQINAWTVDEPGDIELLAAVGIDAIITNVPDIARAALEAYEPPAERRPATERRP